MRRSNAPSAIALEVGESVVVEGREYRKDPMCLRVRRANGQRGYVLMREGIVEERR